MLTIAIGSPKGGVGKTTTVGHLAAIAAQRLRLRVLAVDLDRTTRSLLDWLAKNSDAVGIDVAAATPDEVRKIRRARNYDLVLLDLPGAKGVEFRAVLEGEDGAGPVADHLLMPARPEVMDLRPVVRVARTDVARLQLPYLVAFVNVPDKAIPRARKRQAELRTGSGVAVADTVVRRRVVVDEAVERSCTVLDIPGDKHYARHVEVDYTALAVEVFGPMGIDVDVLRREPSWLE